MKFLYCVDKYDDLVILWKKEDGLYSHIFYTFKYRDWIYKTKYSDHFSNYHSLQNIKEREEDSLEDMKLFMEREFPEWFL